MSDDFKADIFDDTEDITDSIEQPDLDTDIDAVMDDILPIEPFEPSEPLNGDASAVAGVVGILDAGSHDVETDTITENAPAYDVSEILESDNGSLETGDGDMDGPKVLTRDPDELRESGYRAIENNLEAIRDDLRDKGMQDGGQMEEIINQERENLRRGFEHDAFHYGEDDDAGQLEAELEGAETPSDEVSVNFDSMREEALQQAESGASQVYEALQNSEQMIIQQDGTIDSLENMQNNLESHDNNQMDVEPYTAKPISENVELFTDAQQMNTEIDYDEIKNDIPEYDFTETDCFNEPERIDPLLDSFRSSNWESLSIDEKKQAMSDLASMVSEKLNIQNPPPVEYYCNKDPSDFGMIKDGSFLINEYNIDNAEEAPDTIAHELWHVYQQQHADTPLNARDWQYRYGFDNYIPYEYDPMGYQNQLVEAEARAFAQQFKDRISHGKGV